MCDTIRLVFVPTTDVTVGIDVGGSKLCGAAVDGAGRLIAGERNRAPMRGYDAALDAICAMTGRLRDAAAAKGAMVTAAGVATAAFLDADRELVRQATNLGWRDRRLRGDLVDRLE